MRVLAFDPYAPADRARSLGVELVSFEEALKQGDFLSLHMPLIPSTEKVAERDLDCPCRVLNYGDTAVQRRNLRQTEEGCQAHQRRPWWRH
jgi:hypothetical protein